MKKAGIFGLVLVLLLGACRIPEENAPGPQRVSNVPEQLIDDRAEFLRAWAEDDFETTAVMFAQDARVIDGDEVARTPREVQAWLSHQLDECLELSIQQHSFEVSSVPEDAIVERGRYSMIERHGGATGTYTGSYEIEWVWDGDDFIIRTMEFEPGA